MDVIVVSEEFGAKKPDPRIFHYALAKLAVEPEDAWFIGDHPDFDIAAAELGGFEDRLAAAAAGGDGGVALQFRARSVAARDRDLRDVL